MKNVIKDSAGKVGAFVAGGVASFMVVATIANSNNFPGEMTPEEIYYAARANSTAAASPDPRLQSALLEQARKEYPNKTDAQLQAMLLQNAQAEPKFDKDFVARLTKLTEDVDYSVTISNHKNRGTNRRLSFMVSETERFMGENNWVAAEVTYDRALTAMTPEQLAIFKETQVQNHWDKVSRGEYSAYQEVQEINNHKIITPEQARKDTLGIIRDMELRRQKPGNNITAPLVDPAEFGIE